MKLYGSFNNRMEENRMFCDEIKVGTGMTEYSYSDREAWEVIEVINQKHVIVRKYAAKLVGEAYSNDWELISNEDNPEMELVKRGNYWYAVMTATIEMLKKIDESNDIDLKIWLAMNFDRDKILKNGKQSRYYKRNVSFGRADHYFDYEF